MGSLAQLQRAALLLCVPIGGALGDTRAFSMDSNRSHCEKISRNNGLFRLQPKSSSGKKSTAPQSIKQGPPPSGPFCLMPLCASTYMANVDSERPHTARGWGTSTYVFFLLNRPFWGRFLLTSYLGLKCSGCAFLYNAGPLSHEASYICWPSFLACGLW